MECAVCGVRAVFFADADASVGETTALAAQAVRQNMDVEGVYLRPQIREIIERYRSPDPAVGQEGRDLRQ